MFRDICKKMISREVIMAAALSYLLLIISTTGCVWAEVKGVNDVMNENGKYSCLSSQEVELLALVNSYRIGRGLPAINNSRSLNKVARIHVLDLYHNRPTEGKDIHGDMCNLHSWSYEGFWTPVCYTNRNHDTKAMWYKAKEITSYVYSSSVYENAYWTSMEIEVPSRALDAWKKSPTHNALILETGIWQGLNSKAIGVGLYKGYAVIWFGEVTDSQGPMAACSS